MNRVTVVVRTAVRFLIRSSGVVGASGGAYNLSVGVSRPTSRVRARVLHHGRVILHSVKGPTRRSPSTLRNQRLQPRKVNLAHAVSRAFASAALGRPASLTG